MGRMPRFKLARLAAALVAIFTVSACHTPNPINEPCPTFGILGDAERATTFSGTGHDLTDVAYRASLSSASLRCHYTEDKRHPAVKGTLKVNLSVDRGPALSNTEIRIPYFVAITRGQKYVLARNEFSQVFNLKAGTRVGSEEEVPVSIPLAKNMKGDNYEVVVGIILTPDQLAYNRAQKAAR